MIVSKGVRSKGASHPFLRYTVGMDDQIPQQARELLEQFFPGGARWDAELVFRQLSFMSGVAAPSSYGPRAVAAVTLPRAQQRLRPIGRSLDGIVILDPRFGNLDTAAGLALLAHELEHQDQWRSIPDFERQYAQENRTTPRDMPWENPFEKAAYQKERAVFCQLVADGVPRGSWTPLGVQLWGC